MYDFGEVLAKLKKNGYGLGGLGFAREGWNGKNQAIYLQLPDEHSKMTEPYIYMVIKTEDGDRAIPWLASQADMLAEDWFCVN